MMTPARSKCDQRGILIAVCLLIVAAVLYYPFSPAGIQRSNMAKGRGHLPRIDTILADARFRNVRVLPYTGPRLGGLRATGSVASEQDLVSLKSEIEATSPPCEVGWAVQVDPSNRGPARDGNQRKWR